MTSQKLNIAIIGAGPSGCTLARILHQANISVVIFEGERDISVRSQGGTLDLHTDTGLSALKDAGLIQEFKKHARYDGEAFVLCDKKLLKYLNMSGSSSETDSNGRPEIDRIQLRRMLIDSLPKDMIRWGCRLRKVDQDRVLYFDHGIEKGFDLIVGADGAWSKIRPLLSPVQPIYSGIGGYMMKIKNVKERYPDLHKLVNGGSLSSHSDCKSMMAQQLGDGGLAVSYWGVRNEDWQQNCGFNVHNLEHVKKQILEEYGGWDERLLKFAQVADEATPSSLFMLPLGHKWKSQPGVTVIGDAAHLATPFAGEGVNIAMQDAQFLSRAIISASKNGRLDDEVEKFEKDMFVRGNRKQEQTKYMMDCMYFTEDAPRSSIHNIIAGALYGKPWIVVELARLVAWIYFFFFLLIKSK
ncbi:hypothetical protein AKO1_011771 [Acrasis kona]|uniref:FAD-binding domain-containing protein n=1 Tax=Acrasis kona TaxID=1008807 RepID=A0AAW2Z8H9_9EUKA